MFHQLLDAISIFSEINYCPGDPSTMQNLEEVFINLKAFYDRKNKKCSSDFISSKSSELDIHQIITRIFLNLSKVNKVVEMFLQEDVILDDLLDYLTKKSESKENMEKFLSKVSENSKKKIHVESRRKV